MRIKIDHISKIEGQAGFIGHLLNGDVKKAKIEIKEGARLIEGLLIGRRYDEAPIITARVCGICPVIHNLTALKAIEMAFGIKVSPEVILLRKLMLAGQILQSHTLHLFFLTLADYFNLESDIKLIRKKSKEARQAILVRDFGNKIIQVIGGRSIHPVATMVGGFRRWPKKEELKHLIETSKEVLVAAINLAKLFSKLNYPKLERKMECFSLSYLKEYAVYEGDIRSSSGERILAKDFLKNIKEIQKPYEVVKNVEYKGKGIVVGALARINNNFRQLNKEAKKVLRESGFKLQLNNPFYNVFAQAIEVVHFIEESQKLLKKAVKIKRQRNSPLIVKVGKGVAAAEAPRGTLYHFYEIDKNGLIKNCNIITPTAQFLSSLEEDLKLFLPNLRKLSKKERERKIKMLIRAYDLCITCATH